MQTMKTLLLIGLFALAGCTTAAEDDAADDDVADDDAPDDDAADDDAADDDAGDDDAGDDDTGDDDAGDDDTGDDDTGDDDTAAAPDYAQTGPYPVTSTADSTSPDPGCTIPYTVFEPAGAPAAPLVVLTHGFARSEAVVANLAQHFASWGLPTVTLTHCHCGPIDVDNAADAQNMVGLVDLLGATSVIYAGHSAGGQRAVLAAAQDPRAVAVLGLDLVDTSGEATAAAPALTVPLVGIAGEPGGCNDDGDGVPVYLAAQQGRVVRATEADHCDFEDPTDFLCTMFCSGTNNQFTDDQIRSTVRGLATAMLVWHGGLDPLGEQWWTPGGGPYDSLVASGAVTPL